MCPESTAIGSGLFLCQTYTHLSSLPLAIKLSSTLPPMHENMKSFSCFNPANLISKVPDSKWNSWKTSLNFLILQRVSTRISMKGGGGGEAHFGYAWNHFDVNIEGNLIIWSISRFRKWNQDSLMRSKGYIKIQRYSLCEFVPNQILIRFSRKG